MNQSSGQVRSMTGFGMGTISRDGATVMVEVRSVNHRGRKVSVRSRPPLGPLEKQVRDRIQEQLTRGAIDCYVTLTRPLGATLPQAQEELAAAAVHAIRHLAESLKLSGDIEARDLLTVPGLFDSSGEKPFAEEEAPLLLGALDLALTQLVSMRAEEGASTAQSLLTLVDDLEAFAEEARALAPEALKRQEEKIRQRLQDWLAEGIAEADEKALERELCLYADRVDIHEEVERLTSHVAQFRDVIGRGREVGKRLEFLGQEFLREVNTTASKASDTAIISRAIDAKLAVEKIKEQAANIE